MCSVGMLQTRWFHRSTFKEKKLFCWGSLSLSSLPFLCFLFVLVQFFLKLFIGSRFHRTTNEKKKKKTIEQSACKTYLFNLKVLDFCSSTFKYPLSLRFRNDYFCTSVELYSESRKKSSSKTFQLQEQNKKQTEHLL